MQAHQWQWGINQWVEFLRDKDTPVLPRTRAIIAALEAAGNDQQECLSARDLVNIVYADPYLALKLLRRANVSPDEVSMAALLVITTDLSVPGMLAILHDAHQAVPAATLAELAEPLPLPDDIRAGLLAAIAGETAE